MSFNRTDLRYVLELSIPDYSTSRVSNSISAKGFFSYQKKKIQFLIEGHMIFFFIAIGCRPSCVVHCSLTSEHFKLLFGYCYISILFEIWMG
jgi:hypothetical protein